MIELSVAEVEHVALLARLQLTDEEKRKMTRDLSVILEQFQVLQQLDTSGVAPTAHVVPLSNVLREDVSRSSLLREEFLDEAPESRDEYFVVPRVVDTGE